LTVVSLLKSMLYHTNSINNKKILNELMRDGDRNQN